MPAMKPSTTTRARTSRWESRATTAGSSTARAPRGSPRRGPGTEGFEALRSARLPGERQHLAGVGLERAAIPAPEDFPAREAGEAEQELELEAVHPALASLETMGARRPAL